jgi:hypothetical protein
MDQMGLHIHIVAVVGLALVSQSAGAQQTTTSPTLIVGATSLKLGMQRDFVITALSSQYVVKQMSCKEGTSLCREYIIWESDKFPAGSLQFDKDGSLVKATVQRLVGFHVHNEGEVGKALVTVLSNFAAEGLRCSIGASSQESLDPNNPKRVIPAMLWRQATIECGDKRLRIVATKQEGYPDSLDLTEDIGCPSEIVGSCEK